MVQVSDVPTLTVTFLGLNLPLLMLMPVRFVAAVRVALTVLAPGVPLAFFPNRLLNPRCMEQEESNKASAMKMDIDVRRFILFSASRQPAILS